MTRDEIDARAEGADAHAAGASQMENPHDDGTDEWWEWLGGWDDAENDEEDE